VSRSLLAAGLAGALAVAVVVALGVGAFDDGGDSAPAPTRPVTTTAMVGPPTALFGDLVTARADVVVDGRRVEPDSVRIDGDFAPFTLVGSPVRRVTKSGDTVSISFRFGLLCLVDECVPAGESKRFELPAASVRARLLDGSPGDVKLAWPAVNIARRIPESEFSTSSSPRWRRQTELPPVTYGTDPPRLANIVTLLSALLAAAAVGFAAWELERLRRLRRRRVEARSLLARTLDLVRQSTARSADDRRKALAQLARVLAREPVDGRLAGDAKRLAWSRPEPSPAGVEALADEVERESPP
jgi:hypothetical protein